MTFQLTNEILEFYLYRHRVACDAEALLAEYLFCEFCLKFSINDAQTENPHTSSESGEFRRRSEYTVRLIKYLKTMSNTVNFVTGEPVKKTQMDQSKRPQVKTPPSQKRP